MCGIAGTFGLADRKIIKRMVDAQAHRGPDDEGIYIDERNQVALGHRRLAIIDPSSKGHQPMSYGDGRFWITYNGEVYNFADLRIEFEKLGCAFRSDSDTEVILAAYSRWGALCLTHFRGMFAFAIWDAKERELFLARDRFGIKPLLYARLGGVFLFASELKAFLASGLIERRLNKQAVWDYLSFGSVPQPRTIINDVYALPKGCWMRVKAGEELEIKRYWDIFTATQHKHRDAMAWGDARTELRRLLEEATRLSMISDVPIGAFLSGGVDSTAVVGLMNRMVSSPIKTYSVGFETKYTHLNELSSAELAATRFGTEHKEIVVTETEVAPIFSNIIESMDQPSHDGVNTYLVSKAARQGVTVALSGIGGDELFAGYPHFLRYSYWQRLIPEGIPWMPRFWKGLPYRLQSKLEYITSNQLGRLTQARRFFDEQKKNSITNPEFRSSFMPVPHEDLYKQYLREWLDPVTQVSYIELNGYLANTLLRDTDAVSMACALEVRPVLLDHIVAEYIFSLPASMKLYNGRTKILFVDALRDILPPEIAGRTRKMGFELPIIPWLGGPWREDALGALNGSQASFLFTKGFLRCCGKAVCNNYRPPQGLWAVTALLAWMERFKVSL